MAAFNMLYHVGAKDEQPDRTGLAHLFEHLMFGGSENAAKFDEHIEAAGGQSNAFTSNDLTNYYINIPVQNLETAFWLESDRLHSPALNSENIRIQKSVVIEEYKQRNVNQPYGDIWSLLRPLVYKTHPYRWPVIGMDMKHIEEAGDDEIRSFFNSHYCPANAVLCVAGDVDADAIIKMSEKWFGDIARPYTYVRNLPKEAIQNAPRFLEVERNVPQNALYMNFPAPGRMEKTFYASDLLSDIISGGESSRIYRDLVIEKELFTEFDAFSSGDIENGMFILTGKLTPGTSFTEAEEEVWKQLAVIENDINERELSKVKNRTETALAWGRLKALDKAMSLSYFEALGDAQVVNQESKGYQSVSIESCREFAKSIFRENSVSVLRYKSGNFE
jgi:zinc protease